MSALRWLRDFVELRPVFTLRAVQVFWWLYVFERLYNTNWYWRRTVSPSRPESVWLFDWIDWLFTPFRVLVALATVRLLLDVLLALLIPARQPPPPRSLGRDLLAFLDLRPFFTRWWLQVFWWLFLLSFLLSIYVYVAFNPIRLGVTAPGEWFRYIAGFIRPLTWLVGVRLLIEAAHAQQARAEHVPERTGP